VVVYCCQPNITLYHCLSIDQWYLTNNLMWQQWTKNFRSTLSLQLKRVLGRKCLFCYRFWLVVSASHRIPFTGYNLYRDHCIILVKLKERSLPFAETAFNVAITRQLLTTYVPKQLMYFQVFWSQFTLLYSSGTRKHNHVERPAIVQTTALITTWYTILIFVLTMIFTILFQQPSLMSVQVGLKRDENVAFF
jgi:hypothetical protein